MATLEQCRAALDDLAGRLGSPGNGSPVTPGLQRTVSCLLSDLAVTFFGHLRDGRLHNVTTEPSPRAQLRLTTTSDDLVALTSGELAFPSAWASGRLKVEASVLDLLKLRSML